RQDDGASAAQARGGLSQESPREKKSVAPRVGGVNKHDIEVAMQAAVLKAIVQDQDFALQLLHGRPGQRYPIGTLQVGYVGQAFLQDHGLIVPAPTAGIAPA